MPTLPNTPAPTSAASAQRAAQAEWDQTAHETHDPDAPHEMHDGSGADPFPFGHDPWWGKALIVVIAALPFVALAYGIWRWWGHGVGPLEVGLLFGLWAFTGLGVSIGFHRMLTHRSFVARPVTKAVLLVAGTMALEGPPSGWAATHLRHHAKADKEGDPHSPLEGFWHAHFGWLLKDRMVHGGLAMEKLDADPIVRRVSNLWIPLTVLSIALPGLVGLAVYRSWQGALDCLVWGGFVRIALMHHATWAVNSVCHTFGTRPFKTPDVARNNAAIALLAWGEGWHNNHHAFPRAAYHGMRWYQVDVSKWVIRLLAAMGQVTQVWNPDDAAKKARSAHAGHDAPPVPPLEAKPAR